MSIFVHTCTIAQAHSDEDHDVAWANIQPGLIEAWQAFGAAFVAVEDSDDAISGWTAGQELRHGRAYANLIIARVAYLDLLTKLGVVKRDEQVPEDQLLWESHPGNLRAELDNPA